MLVSFQIGEEQSLRRISQCHLMESYDFLLIRIKCLETDPKIITKS